MGKIKMTDRIDKLLDFLKEIEKFKNVERVTLSSNRSYENDMEHSWHLAMFLILFEKDLPKNLDMAKVLKLALIHDIAELYVGDISIFDEEKRKTKKDEEMKAAKKLFSQLPRDIGNDFMTLFEDYEEQKSSESKIVKLFDKLQPILQNICSKGESWKKSNLKYEDIDKLKRKYVEHDFLLKNIYDKLMGEAREKGFL